jgi:hypothetical protein
MSGWKNYLDQKINCVSIVLDIRLSIDEKVSAVPEHRLTLHPPHTGNKVFHH